MTWYGEDAYREKLGAGALGRQAEAAPARRHTPAFDQGPGNTAGRILISKFRVRFCKKKVPGELEGIANAPRPPDGPADGDVSPCSPRGLGILLAVFMASTAA
jgi:hypothetical protein